MALTVKHLNGDASFLLSFEPVITNPTPGLRPEPFRILLDPWITGPSKIFHPKISISTHKEPACIESLRELPAPDLVIISQHKSDHCNEATLKQLPAAGTKTIILAEPASARLIRSWKYFEREKVRTIQRWEDPRLTGRDTVVRIPVPPVVDGGEPGEVTVAFVPQRRDISGLHAAVGITYRPPPVSQAPLSTLPKRLLLPRAASPATVLTPPETPKSYRSFSHLPSIFTSSPFSSGPSLAAPQTSAPRPNPPRADTHLSASPPTPTSSGFSLRSVRSASSIAFSRQSTLTANSSFHAAYSPAITAASANGTDRPVSVLFSPHGISYASLEPYAASHLVAEAALPLTALLHCFDAVSNPWWLGGNILLGAPAGRRTAARLGARAWISAHDGDKEVRGLATRLLRTRRFGRDEVSGGFADEAAGGGGDEPLEKGPGTEVLSLGTGEEVLLTREGVAWNAEPEEPVKLGPVAGMGLAPTIEIQEAEPGGFINVGEVMASVRVL